MCSRLHCASLVANRVDFRFGSGCHCMHLYHGSSSTRVDLGTSCKYIHCIMPCPNRTEWTFGFGSGCLCIYITVLRQTEWTFGSEVAASTLIALCLARAEQSGLSVRMLLLMHLHYGASPNKVDFRFGSGCKYIHCMVPCPSRTE